MFSNVQQKSATKTSCFISIWILNEFATTLPNDGLVSSKQSILQQFPSMIIIATAYCANVESLETRNDETGVQMSDCVLPHNFKCIRSILERIEPFFYVSLFALRRRNGIFPVKICCKIIIQTKIRAIISFTSTKKSPFQAKTIRANDGSEWVLCFVIDVCSVQCAPCVGSLCNAYIYV